MLIVVTGAAGFLGSHLCDKLILQGHTVIAIDNFETGSKENIKHLLSNNKFNFHDHDVIQTLEWLDFIPIDQIYHLASIASPEHYCAKSLETIYVNTIGTENLLKLAKLHNAKFLLTSTSEVYGDPEEHPQKESYKGNVNTYGPRACYDESKRLAETITYEYRRLYSIDTKIVRIFNTYGTRMNLNDKRVIIEFVKNALQNEPLKVHGKGIQTRSFCYVDDMVEGLIKMMNSGEEGPINLGNDKAEFTVEQIGKMIIDKTRSESKIEYVGRMQDDPLFRRPDISKAKEKLEWEPKICISEGLDKTIEYVKTQLKN